MSALVKPLTKLLALAFIVLGIAGFFTGDTLWIFEVDPIHNTVHIVSGLLGLMAMKTYTYSRLYLIMIGLIYGVVTVLGFAMNGDILGIFHANQADNLLHLVIASLSLTIGFGSKQK